jgi:hypothetical protein
MCSLRTLVLQKTAIQGVLPQDGQNACMAAGIVFCFCFATALRRLWLQGQLFSFLAPPAAP